MVMSAQESGSSSLEEGLELPDSCHHHAESSHETLPCQRPDTTQERTESGHVIHHSELKGKAESKNYIDRAHTFIYISLVYKDTSIRL